MKTIMIVGAIALMAAAPQADRPLTLQPLMAGIVAPQAQILWDIGNSTLNDEGQPDGSKLTARNWAAIVAAAEKLHNAGQAMAGATRVAAAIPGGKIQDEGSAEAATSQQVQAFISADPKGFAEHGRRLAEMSEAIRTAAVKQDPAGLTAISEGLDQVCEDCHKRFWYPDRKP